MLLEFDPLGIGESGAGGHLQDDRSTDGDGMRPKKAAGEERPIVQTVKLELPLFVRLKTFGAKTRRSNQDILRSALIEYLSKQRA